MSLEITWHLFRTRPLASITVECFLCLSLARTLYYSTIPQTHTGHAKDSFPHAPTSPSTALHITLLCSCVFRRSLRGFLWSESVYHTPLARNVMTATRKKASHATLHSTELHSVLLLL
ncbi:hypothetical protein BJ546DRAFT_650865 [Cryomyces antarcticus]